jgi:hypothetical protein
MILFYSGVQKIQLQANCVQHGGNCHKLHLLESTYLESASWLQHLCLCSTCAAQMIQFLAICAYIASKMCYRMHFQHIVLKPVLHGRPLTVPALPIAAKKMLVLHLRCDGLMQIMQ